MKNIARLSVYLIVIFLIFITCSKDDVSEPTPPPPAKVTYTLSTSINPADGGTVSPASGTYDKGDVVTFTATPNTNFEFKNWLGGATGTDNPITVTFNGNKSITAVFEEVPPVYKNGEGEVGPLGGTVMIDDANSPLNGVKIEIPEGALKEDVNISIQQGTETSFADFQDILMIKLKPEGLEFEKAVTLSLPYKKELENPTVFYHVADSNSVQKFVPKSFDKNKKTVTTEIQHFSEYFVDEDSKFYVNIELYKLSGNTKVKVEVGGIRDGVDGLRGLRTNALVNNLSAYEMIQTNLYNGIFYQQELYMTMNIKLLKSDFFGFKWKQAETKITVMRTGDSDDGFNLHVINMNDENDIGAGLYDVSTAELEMMFNGSGLVIPLDHVIESGENYYVEVSWVLSNNKWGKDLGAVSGIGKEHITAKYIINSDKISSYEYSDIDKNGNYMNDDYDPKAPTVETLQPSDIKENSAVLKGNVLSDGRSTVTQRGFYYATHANPTESDNMVEVSGKTGSFSETVNLDSNYNYHYRAFATNGVDTSVGNAIPFETLNVAPEVAITEPPSNSSYQKGELVIIKATAEDNDGGLKSVKIYIDNTLKETFTPVQSVYTYNWDTSNATKGNHEIKVIATDSDDTTKSALRTVEIRDGNLAVTKPNTNTEWTVGDQNVTISWDTGELGGNVLLELYKGEDRVEGIINSTENDGSYNSFDVPQVDDGGNFRVRIKSLKYSDKTAFSDYFWVIEPENFAPSAPAEEAPTDGVEIEGTSTTLSWSCSDPEEDSLTYDVYFGDSEKPQLVSEGQSGTTYDVSELIGGTTYYWYLEAHDDKNSTQSMQWSFTVAEQSTTPTVTTTSITEFTSNTATVGGNVTSDGGATVSERGIYWGTETSVETTGTKLVIGSGIGEYSSSLIGLIPNTTYFIKAFATNEKGTSFGIEMSFVSMADAELSNAFSYKEEVFSLDNSTITYWGNENGLYEWSFDLFSSDFEYLGFEDGTENRIGVGHIIYFDFYTSSANEIPSGTYNYSRIVSEGNMYNSEFTVYKEGHAFYYDIEIETGQVIILKNGDSYNISFDVADQEGSPLLGEYEGVPSYDDKSQEDSDSDNVPDNMDQCPNTPEAERDSVDENGCSMNQLADDDNDGVSNEIDLCPNTPNGEVVDSNGCSINTSLNNQINYNGQTFDLSWGEIIYYGIADDYAYESNFNGKHDFYLALFPSQIINDPVNGLNGEAWYIEIEPLMTDSSSPIGTYHEDFTGLYFDNPAIFVNDRLNEEEGQNEEYNINNNLTLIINKINDEYEITISGQDENMNDFNAHYKGPLIETTDIRVPDIQSSYSTNIVDNSAIIWGNISTSNGSPITERGFYWGISPNPEINGTKLIVGNGIGEYSATLNNLSPLTEYYYKPFATNEIGTSYGDEQSFTTLEENNSGKTYVPDDNFENYLETHDANGNSVSLGSEISLGDGIEENDYVLTDRIKDVTTLEIQYSDLKDLTGIAGFVNLLTLNLEGNSISFMDFSDNKNLEILELSYSNSLESINLSKNFELKILELTHLYSLNILDISNNTNLQKLRIANYSKLSELNLSNNTLIRSLEIWRCDLFDMNKIQNLNLYYLSISDNNELINFDISNFKDLSSLHLTKCNLDTFDFSQNLNLKDLVISNNNLTSFNYQDISLTKLETIDISHNQLTEIIIPESNWLEEIKANDNKIQNFSTEHNDYYFSINTIILDNNLLTSLDLRKVDFMYLSSRISARNNNLTSVNLSDERSNWVDYVDFRDNPDLNCIKVFQYQLDNMSSHVGKWLKDDNAIWSTDCN